MGRFVHEALAIDPATGMIYETEDRGTAGFYRFTPNQYGKLAAGGRLQMMKVFGADDLRGGFEPGRTFDVAWVEIDEPTLAHSTSGNDALGVQMQGRRQGAAIFARLEGCWYGEGSIYVVSTSGGAAKSGQVWQYIPGEEKLRLIFESPGADVLDSPDNITVSPRGGILLCEDGDIVPHRLHGLTPDGGLFTLASNNIVLKGEVHDIKGDFRAQEWAGATFSPDGNWLFVNIQKPGVTFAITGPWEAGVL